MLDSDRELLGRVLLVVAHPDDEVAGCGILLQRVVFGVVAIMTDGAPLNKQFWKEYGSREKYSAVRREETTTALSGLGNCQVERFEAIDQQLHTQLKRAVEWTSRSVEKNRPDAIVTHAYEGGHPDHDCCSLISLLVGKRFQLPVWEMPLYRLEDGELAIQRFLGGRPVTSMDATAVEEETKRRMLGAYRSQSDFIQKFDSPREQFRRQPAYDYGNPPHPGPLNYEQWKWQATGAELCKVFTVLLEGQDSGKASA